MIFRIHLLFCAVCWMLFCADESRADGTHWVLLVGVDDYAHVTDLKYCSDDVVALRSALIELGVPDNQIKLLHDRAAENRFRPFRANILRQLDLVLKLATADDTILIAFSGHGLHLDNRSYLCPAEADPDDTDTLISLDDVYDQLQKSSAGVRVLIVDACRNNPRVPGSREIVGEGADFVRALEVIVRDQTKPEAESILLLTSCAPGEKSYEEPEFGHGVFSHFLLQGLKGKADSDNNGIVSFHELAEYAGHETKTYVADRFNASQRPFLRGDLEIDTLRHGFTLGSNIVDWPRFRGPNGSGLAPRANLVTTWSDNKNLLWKVSLPGKGTSSPIVVGDAVLVTCYTGEKVVDGEYASIKSLERHLVCYERSTGRQRWVAKEESQHPAHSFFVETMFHGYSTNTPCSDGQSIWAFHSFDGVYAYDLDGNRKWHASLSGKTPPRDQTGSAASVTCSHGRVFVQADYERSSLFAFDGLSGKELWRFDTGSPGMTNCSTPIFFTHGEKELLVYLSPKGRLDLVDSSTGMLFASTRAEISGDTPNSPVSSPETIFVVSDGFSAYSLQSEGGQGGVARNWLSFENEMSYTTPIAVGGKLIEVADLGIMSVVDSTTGALKNRSRLGFRGRIFSSPVADSRHLFVVSETDGTVVVDHNSLAVVAHNRFESDDSNFNATPAISGNLLFLRSDKFLYCIGEKP
ncbi:MAG: caspase family protein [Planctomycetaceae bacterium]|nr:caspase family protein [Planctomycetaceae bacterium]